MKEKCKGCRFYKIKRCRLITHYEKAVDNCPCLDCLVKPMCRAYCQERKRYYFNNVL